MQDIKTLVRKLRAAANVLEELFIGNGTAAIAQHIIEGPRKKLGRPPKLPRSPTKKGFTYKGRHWTQRPENKKKLLAMAERSANTRMKKDRIKAVDDARLKPGWAAVKHG